MFAKFALIFSFKYHTRNYAYFYTGKQNHTNRYLDIDVFFSDFKKLHIPKRFLFFQKFNFFNKKMYLLRIVPQSYFPVR